MSPDSGISDPILREDLERLVRALGTRARVFEGRTVLVCGGAGFLGTYFVATLHLLNRTVLRRPCRIVALDNYITSSPVSFAGPLRGPHLRRIQADVCKPLRIPGPVDYIIHAAGLASPVYYKRYPLETIESAVTGAKNLLELARSKRVRSFLFFSSSEIYGDPDPRSVPTPETYKGSVSSTGPRACYDESKRLGETICMIYHQVHGVPVKVVRPFNVYGPGMRPNDYRVIPTFVTRGLKGLPLRVHNRGGQTRTFCYVTDAVTGFFKVLLSPRSGEVYNVGADRPEISMLELARTVARLLGNNAAIRRVGYPEAYPADEPRRRRPDLAKIRRELGYSPAIDLETGLGRMIAWYRAAL